MKVRQNLYIDREIADTLEALETGPSGTKSRPVNDTLAAWRARRGTKEIDDLPEERLDRMSRELATIRRDGDELRESLSLFVRCQVSVTAPLPKGDKIALAFGRDRFETFVGHVGRQLASGMPTLAALIDKGAG